MNQVSFILPFPSFTANNRNIYAHKKVFNSPKYVAYRKECYIETRSIACPKFSGDVELYIGIYPPNKRRRDIDNYLKVVQDVITYCGIWGDDSQVTSLHAQMNEVSDDPRIMVRIAD